MATLFTCSVDVAITFAQRCDERIKRTEFDIATTRLAIGMWEPIDSDEARRAVGLLRALAAEAERHHLSLLQLRDQLAMHAERDVHEHLEPLDAYVERVWQCLFAAPDVDPCDSASAGP